VILGGSSLTRIVWWMFLLRAVILTRTHCASARGQVSPTLLCLNITKVAEWPTWVCGRVSQLLKLTHGLLEDCIIVALREISRLSDALWLVYFNGDRRDWSVSLLFNGDLVLLILWDVAIQPLWLDHGLLVKMRFRLEKAAFMILELRGILIYTG
jgi:hypothetical protein